MKILIVDDEIVSRTKLSLIMKNFGACDAVDNGKDALALFRTAHHKEEPYNLIMLDVNMPDMNGIEVLAEIREFDQDFQLAEENRAKILMVTSNRDRDRIVESIKSGCNDYIGKPFDIGIIRERLAKLGIYEPGRESEGGAAKASAPESENQFIDSISSAIERQHNNLPTLPKIRSKFHEKVARGAVSRQLAELLKMDIAISSELMRSANSVVYRGFIANKSLEHAISRLGIEATCQLVDELTGRDFFTMQNRKYRSLLEQLWKHSIACAFAAEIVAYALKLKMTADPYFLGLMHDIGKLVLLQILADMERKGKINEDVSGIKLVNTINQHHGLFGARVLEKWKYSEIYINSALNHDNPAINRAGDADDEEPPPEELLVINFADNLSKTIGFDLNGSNGGDSDLKHTESAMLLKLTSQQIDQVRETVIEEMKGTEALF